MTRVTCGLKTYLEETRQNQLTTRLARASVIFLCVMLIILLALALSNLIPGVMVLAASFTVTKLVTFLVSLIGNLIVLGFFIFGLVISFRENKRAFEIHNPACSIYYEGIRHWDLGRSSLGPGEVPISGTLFPPFESYGLDPSIAGNMFLFMEHFGTEPPKEPLVDGASCLIRDFRPYVNSLCFVIVKQGSSLKTKGENTICEAFRSDYDAHLAMIDCYRLIHSKLIIERRGLKSIDVIPSVMVRGDYPSRYERDYRAGLLRVYGGNGLCDFPTLVPNERLPMGPFFVPKQTSCEGDKDFSARNVSIILGLNDVLKLCLLQRCPFALQWDNISVRRDYEEEEPVIKIRSLEPKVSQISPTHGLLCSTLVQWASILGSEEQLFWLEETIKHLTFPKSLGSKDAVIIDSEEVPLNANPTQDVPMPSGTMKSTPVVPETGDSLPTASTFAAAEDSTSEAGRESFSQRYALVLQGVPYPEPPKEPLVMFTDQEKSLILEATRARRMELDLYNGYLADYELSKDEIQKHVSDLPENWRTNWRWSERLYKFFFKTKKEGLEEIFLNKELGNMILARGLAATQSQARIKVFNSLVAWLLQGFNVGRSCTAKPLPTLKLDLFKSEFESKPKNNILTEFLVASDEEILFKGLRVLEPGIEGWYDHPDQAGEIRSVLEGLVQAGRISGYWENQPCGRFVLRGVGERRTELVELLESLVASGEIMQFFESSDEEGAFIIDNEPSKTAMLKQRFKSCVRTKLVGSFADESLPRGRFTILV
ncbi:hypothetical protein X556_0275 [Chlamydia pneumoniae B21]|nr:hypothetical protein X556_0275 [Chlamydia pneumoniae B21]